MPKNLTCFISHNSKDKPFANRLCATLESQGINTWYDKNQIFPGDSITDKVQYGLQNYDIFIIILSNNSINAPWVKEELRVAYQNRLSESKQKRIIPLLLDNCEIPLFLKDYLYIPFKTQSQYSKSANLLLDAIIFDKEYLKKYKANYSGGFFLNEVKVNLNIEDHSLCSISETFSITPLKKIQKITKDFVFDGQLLSINFDSGQISKNKIRANTERWELIFDKPILPKRALSFHLGYKLRDEFRVSQNWFYTIDSPTRLIEFRITFNKTNLPNDFRIKYFQTLTKMKEKILKKKIINGDICFTHRIKYPTYKDRFELEWT